MRSLKNPRLEAPSFDISYLTHARRGQVNSIFGKKGANLCWQPERRTIVVTVRPTKDGDSISYVTSSGQ